MLQHKPRSTTVPEPSSVIVPPEVALIPVMLLTDDVSIMGTIFFSQELRKRMRIALRIVITALNLIMIISVD